MGKCKGKHCVRGGMKHDRVGWSFMWSGVAFLMRMRWERGCEAVTQGTHSSLPGVLQNKETVFGGE